MSISLSLEEAVGRYVADVESRQCSTAHIRTVRHRLGRFLRGREGMQLRDSAAELNSYFRELREAGLASGTLAGHKGTHLAFWRWCAGRRWCSAKAADVLRSRSNRYSFRPVRSRAANAADFAAVVACLPSFAAHRGWRARDVRDAALVSLVVDSGKRRGEVWSLRRVDMVRALERPEPLGGGRSVYHVESHDGKTGPVSVRFYDESATLLRRWMELLPAGAVYVFVNLRTGVQLREDALHLGVLRVCEFAGVPKFRFHAIRKRVVTDVISATGDYKIGQLMAGHADERTTQRYYNDVQQSVVDAAAGALAARFRGEDLAGQFFQRC